MPFFRKKEDDTDKITKTHESDKAALQHFEALKPPAGQLSKLHRQSSRHHKPDEPSVPDSYIKVGEHVYRILPSKKRGGEIAGAGNEAKVKYVKRMPQGTQATLKIDNYQTAQNRQYDACDEEAVIAQDVGFFLDVGTRVKPTKYNSKSAKANRSRALPHRYAIMPDYGKELLVHLFYNYHDISDAERHDIAIQACAEVFKLHQGIAAKSKKTIAHRDIKLENFLYDPETKTVKLGDYGFAEYDPSKQAKTFRYTSAYFPYISSSSEINRYTLEELDIFALKRSCHRPRWTKQIKHGRVEQNDPGYSILPLPLLQKLKLEHYFMTEEEKGQYHSALFLSHTLILALYNRTDLITTNESIQKALLVLYTAKALSKEAIQHVYKNQDYRIKLAELIMELNHIEEIVLPAVPINKKDSLPPDAAPPPGLDAPR